MNYKKNIDKIIRANKNAVKEIFRSKKIHTLKSINYFNIFNEVHDKSAPCFVLSTGRCGTHMLTKLLSEHKKIDVFHTPNPELIYYSKYAFENNAEKNEELSKIVDAARYDYIRDSYLLGQHFVETNNRITFFANQLAQLYPKATFIHLVRHPAAFVKSGFNRGWYSGKNEHDEGRIELKGEEWNQYSDLKKIAWLWEATNKFIEDFKDKIEPERVILLKSEELFSDAEKVENIFRFLSLDPINSERIKSIISKPTNVGKTKRKDQLSGIELNEINQVTESAKKYGYE